MHKISSRVKTIFFKQLKYVTEVHRCEYKACNWNGLMLVIAYVKAFPTSLEGEL